MCLQKKLAKQKGKLLLCTKKLAETHETNFGFKMVECSNMTADINNMQAMSFNTSEKGLNSCKKTQKIIPMAAPCTALFMSSL